MKRTALKRRSPNYKRTKHVSKYKRRERDIPYMLKVKELACVAAFMGPCEGVVEADHAGPRGISQKADDHTTIPICTGHHRARTDFTGPFKHWVQADMRAFLADAIVNTQLLLGWKP